MENFKDKYQTNLPEITSQETQEVTPTTDNEVGTQAGEQGLQQDLCDPELTGHDNCSNPLATCRYVEGRCCITINSNTKCFFLHCMSL